MIYFQKLEEVPGIIWGPYYMSQSNKKIVISINIDLYFFLCSYGVFHLAT